MKTNWRSFVCGMLLLVASTAHAAADLGVTVDVNPTTLNVGQTTTFTVVVTNFGPDTSPTATLTLEIVQGLSWQTVNCNRPGSGNPPRVWVGVLANGQSVTCTVGAQANGNVTGMQSAAASISPGGSNFDNDSAGYTVTVNPPPSSVNLVVLKGGSAGSIFVGDSLTFTISVTNSGALNATGVVVSDTLPTGLTGGTVNCNRSGAGTLPTVWSGSLGAGLALSCSFLATANGAALGTLQNTATATSTEPDSSPINNSSTATVVVQTIKIFGNGFES